jgi:hypothetical protein
MRLQKTLQRKFILRLEKSCWLSLTPENFGRNRVPPGGQNFWDFIADSEQ